MLKLPRLLSSGCVLQQGKYTRIWGWSDKGVKVTVEFQGMKKTTLAAEAGKWEVFLPNLAAGGPFKMSVADSIGDSIEISDIYVGEVWVCSGQSNMELPMARVRDRYPKELGKERNPYIRLFQIKENYEFDEPRKDCESGEWLESAPEYRQEFSAVSYFFGQYLWEDRKVPVGLINASKGGSRIEAWMSRESLIDYPHLLEEADKYKGKEAAGQFVREQERISGNWIAQMGDAGTEKAYLTSEADEKWKNIHLPGWLEEAGIHDFSGCIWLRHVFEVPETMAGKEAMLWLGTLVDSDRTYVNGEFVGETGYQYPPRKYPIPAGLLRKGKNEIRIRLVCNDGHGRVTPGKEFCLFAGSEIIELGGDWQYRIQKRTEKAPEMDFLCRKAAGLYNGMLAPCQDYTIRGVLWYQGESNDRRPGDYEDLLKRMILSWREGWGEEKLPFIVIQLPVFSIDLLKENLGWPKIREAQGRAAELPNVAVTINLDLGEYNDLHPQDKQDIAYRASLAARQMVYGDDVFCRGPVLKECRFEGNRVRLFFDPGDGGLLTTRDGCRPGEFCLAGKDRKFYPAKCELMGNQAVLTSKAVKEAAAVRYAFSNAPEKGLLCNRSGFLAAPFRTDDWE